MRPADPPAGTAAVSVVVATRNRRDDLLASLDHVRAARPHEVIVVDNASTDGTAAAVAQAFPEARIVRLSQNRGSVARTVGVRAATCPVVAFADDDSWWAPGALHRAGGLFARHPRLGLVAARILVGPDDRLDPVSAEMARSPLRSSSGSAPAVLGSVACGTLVRREAYLQVGGFSDLLFFIGEERMLALDLASAGWDLVYASEVVAHHHPGPRPDSADRRATALRNDLLIEWSRRPAAHAARATARLAATAVADTVRSPGDPAARRALGSALARLPRALEARRRIPDHVEVALAVLERRSTDRRAGHRRPIGRRAIGRRAISRHGPDRRAVGWYGRDRRASDGGATQTATDVVEDGLPVPHEPVDPEAGTGGPPPPFADPAGELGVGDQVAHDGDEAGHVGVDEAVDAVLDDGRQLGRR